jgi:hypothetical protein
MRVQGTIVDFEGTHFNADKGELVTAGFLSNDGFTIVQRCNLAESEFKATIIDRMQRCEKPWYAYHKQCEEGFSGLTIERELQDGRESTYTALRRYGLLEHYNALCDPLFNEEIPAFWDVWTNTRNLLFLSKIVRHNYCCLAKEYYLKLRKEDTCTLDDIPRLRSSAPIEKNYIRPLLHFERDV